MERIALLTPLVFLLLACPSGKRPCANDDSCESGERCIADSAAAPAFGFCSVSDEPQPIPDAGVPSCVDDDGCGTNELCIEGRCAPNTCLGDVVCLPHSLLCDIQNGRCIEPRILTAGCSAADAFGPRDRQGPVLYAFNNTPLNRDATLDSAACQGDLFYAIRLRFVDNDGDGYAPGDGPTASFRVSTNGTNSVAVINNFVGAPATDGESGTFVGGICLTQAATVAFQIEDHAGNRSNAVCVAAN